MRIPFSLACALLVSSGCTETTLFDVNLGNPIEVTWIETAPDAASPGAQLVLAVRLTGSDTRGVENWPVVWQSRSLSPLVTASQGLVSADTTFTDADGIARVVWTLGEEPGTYVLDVQAAYVQRAASGLREPLSPLPGPDVMVEAILP